MKLRIAAPLFYIFISITSVSVGQNPSDASQSEIIYHVFQRSFYDSNEDLMGDLNGLTDKLDYLQDLGVTSILTLPTCESPYYHNYFSNDFEKIDPSYGSMEDWVALVKEVHKRKMKIYLDMEMQYVTEDHPWFKDSYNNPKSVYSNYVLYTDSNNSAAEPMMFGITELGGYNGVMKKIAIVNVYNKNVRDYYFKIFSGWVDPNHDGKFEDGVDGFRLDHMMDDLDWKGKLTNLYDTLWRPLFTQLKKENPALKNVAEQADWRSFGYEYFDKGGVDRVFAFRLQQAIASFNKEKLESAADSTFSFMPKDKEQVVFIENHDMDRFSTQVKKDPGKLRVGAALNLLLGGVPSIYYGQELGMFGSGGFQKFGSTDANDIPRREAFEWYKADSGKGMSIWYKNTGIWWTQTNLIPNDGVSLEEEKTNPNSLLNFYKSLIKVRQGNEALTRGVYQSLANDNENVFSFIRNSGNEEAFVIVNLSDVEQQSGFNIPGWTSSAKNQKILYLFGDQSAEKNSGRISVSLPAYGITVFEMK